ncbi:MAG: PRC-barrel domain-containing protein [Sphingobium sp.]
MADTLATDETNRLIASDKVDGTAVYDRAGNKLGSVKNFMVDKRTGKAEYAVLQFGGFLGIGSDYYPLPWDMLDYETEQGGYVVDITKEQLDDAPRYTETEDPVFDRTYGESVYGYYGRAYPFI